MNSQYAMYKYINGNLVIKNGTVFARKAEDRIKEH